ncbi:MAG: zf-TFIIB domain-containing protein [Kiritimatiellaceae bacterium]|nr:zf-TFIIB domain-containing protein [Kiritimatiellaceae bacterium]
MNCPKCAKEMKQTKYKNVEYDQCKGCGGLWFDALEAEDLVEMRDAAQIDTGDVKKGSELNKKRLISCPVCNIQMAKTHDREQPHIQLETCLKCNGAFFDAGEFKDFCEETFMDRIKDWIAIRR